MNAAAIEALRQALGYYREGVTSSRKRAAQLADELAAAEAQVAHAEGKVRDLTAALNETAPAPEEAHVPHETITETET